MSISQFGLYFGFMAINTLGEQPQKVIEHYKNLARLMLTNTGAIPFWIYSLEEFDEEEINHSEIVVNLAEMLWEIEVQVSQENP